MTHGRPVDPPVDPLTAKERDDFQRMARMLRHEEVLAKVTTGGHPFDIDVADYVARLGPEDARMFARHIALGTPVQYSGREVTYERDWGAAHG